MSKAKYTKVYKVVSEDMTSALKQVLPESFRIKYKVMGWTLPKRKSKIFVFKEFEKARQFSRMFPDMRVYEGYAENATQTKNLWNGWSEIPEVSLSYFWKTGGLTGYIYGVDIKEDSDYYACDRVFLRKRVL